MEIILLPKARADLQYWQKTNNKLILKRIATIIKSIVADPWTGIGKPEPLRHELSGKWSRRLDREDQVIYALEDGVIYIYSLKGHY